MEQPIQKPVTFAELTKRKAELQKTRGHAFSKYHADKSRHPAKGLIGPNWGGRNGQGKP